MSKPLEQKRYTFSKVSVTWQSQDGCKHQNYSLKIKNKKNYLNQEYEKCFSGTVCVMYVNRLGLETYLIITFCIINDWMRRTSDHLTVQCRPTQPSVWCRQLGKISFALRQYETQDTEGLASKSMNNFTCVFLYTPCAIAIQTADSNRKKNDKKCNTLRRLGCRYCQHIFHKMNE